MQMNRIIMTVMMLSMVALPTRGDQADAASGDGAPTVEVARSGSQPSAKGAAEYFTGAVRIDPLFQPHGPSRTSGGLVTFEPSARMAWHTHPLGQTLIVTSGLGWVQPWDGPRQEIRPGDVVRIPPGVKHWHGATAATGVTHIAIQESVDGKNVDWMEQVSDEQYRAEPGSP